MDCSSKTVPLAYSVFDFNMERRDNKLPVVIVHSLLSNRKTWEFIAIKLARQMGTKVYTIDLRNHGDSPHHEDGNMQDNYTLDLELFLQTKEITKCHFIGHSLGGKLQLLLSFVKPELVESLILVDIVPLPAPDAVYVVMKKNAHMLRNCIEDLNDSEISKLQEAKKFCEEELKTKITPKSFKETIIQSLKMTEKGYEWSFNIDILEKHFDNMMDFDTTDRVFKGPTLVIAPDISIFVKPEELKKVYCVLPNMSCVKIPNVSHHLHLDAPEQFIKHCLEFWSRI